MSGEIVDIPNPNPAPGMLSVEVTVRVPIPWHDRIVVKPQEDSVETSELIAENTSKDDERKRPLEGEVLYVGPGKLTSDGVLHPIPCRQGDRVLYGRYSGTMVRIDQQEYLFLREDEILASVETKTFTI